MSADWSNDGNGVEESALIGQMMVEKWQRKMDLIGPPATIIPQLGFLLVVLLPSFVAKIGFEGKQTKCAVLAEAVFLYN